MIAASRVFVLQTVAYFIVSLGYRALVQSMYIETFVTDVLYALATITALTHLLDNKTRFTIAAYALGGASGSVIAIFVADILWGKV